MPAEAVDGMDVLAVEAAARRAADARARAATGPFLLELRTYRFRAHSMYDPELYRDEGGGRASGSSAIRSRCFVARLRASGLARPTPIWPRIEAAVAAEVDEAVAVRRGRALGAGRGPDSKDVYTPVTP